MAYNIIKVSRSLSKIYKYFDECIPGVIVSEDLTAENLTELKALCLHNGIRLIMRDNDIYTEQDGSTISPIGLWYLSPLYVVQDRK